MFATTGIIEGNGKKQFITIPDAELSAVSDSLISQNMEAYKELAYCFWANEQS